MDPFEYESELEVYPSGKTIFQAGDAGDRMYVVAAGSVQVKIDGQVVETVGAGGTFGEMALLGSHIRSATAEAGEDCRLLSIDRDFFLHLVRESPGFSLKVMEAMADRLRRSNRSRT